jgi:predicted ester cyclase
MIASSEDKETVRQVFDAFYAADADTMLELLSPDFVAHSMPPGFSKDQKGFLEMARQWVSGFSDDDTTLDELLAAEDGRVITRFTTRAAHTGDAFGVPATDRRLTMTGIEIYAVAEGKVTDWWGEINMSELFDVSPEQAAPGTSEQVE